MNNSQFRHYPAKRGCTFEPGKGGHLEVRRGDKSSYMPRHGGRKRLGKGLMEKIKKDLAIE